MGLKKMNKEIMRREAKKIYKDKVKGIPRKDRLPFSKFFKEYMKMKEGKSESILPETEADDFDFSEYVNFNKIDDDNLEIEDNNQEESE